MPGICSGVAVAQDDRRVAASAGKIRGRAHGGVLFWMRPGLRTAAAENLTLAFPGWSKKQRRAAIRGMVRQLGWMAAEFAHFPSYTKNNIERIVLLDGFENFATAQAQAKESCFSPGI